MTREERERSWRELLERQAASGLSVRRFCGREGVSEPSFYQWRKRLGVTTRKKIAAAPPRDRAAAPAATDSLFLPLGLLGGASRSELEIVHPAGCRVRVVGEVNVASLTRVLEALDERGAR
ncbi:MAG: hypothetical protein U1A77_00055 [Pirellulales bacterium]